jgi:hypothetical protein
VVTGLHTVFEQAHLSSGVFLLQVPTPAIFMIKHFSYQAPEKAMKAADF